MTEPPEPSRPVVLDTGIWGHLYVNKKPDARTPYWRRLLTGRTLVIAAQTRAEVLYGLYAAKWGPARLTAATARLDATNTVPVDEDIIQAYARLSTDCKAAGHALHADKHSGDMWIAATALVLTADLLSADHIFRGAPGLFLLPPDEP